MADDDDIVEDIVPEKELPSPAHGASNSGDRKNQLSKKAIEQLSHADLEDRYLRLQDDHMLLKKYVIKQEDKIKRTTAKLARVLNARKKLEKDGENNIVKRRDVETEEMIDGLQSRVRELELQNMQLKEKLLVAKQRTIVTPRKPASYMPIGSKIDTGRAKSNLTMTSTVAAKGSSNRVPSRSVPAPQTLPPYVIQLLDEARIEINHLEEVIAGQHAQMDVCEQEIEALTEQIKVKDAEHQEELMSLRAQVSQGQRHHVQENIDLIRLHREVKRKSTKITSLQAQYLDLEDKTRVIRDNHEQIVTEVGRLSSQLKEEQNRNFELQTQLEQSSALQRTISQLQDQVSDLKKDNEILKGANDKLVNSVFETEDVQRRDSVEKQLRAKILKLEATLKESLEVKAVLLNRLEAEKERCKELQEKLQKSDYALNQLLIQLQEKHQKDSSTLLEETVLNSNTDLPSSILAQSIKSKPVPKPRQQRKNGIPVTSTPIKPSFNCDADSKASPFQVKDRISEEDKMVAAKINPIEEMHRPSILEESSSLTTVSSLEESSGTGTSNETSDNYAINKPIAESRESSQSIETDSDVSGASDGQLHSTVRIDRIGHTVTGSPLKMPSKLLSTITITVSHLQLEENAEVLKNPDIQNLFIEYQFLDYPPDDLQTPFAVPKPKFGSYAIFNFTKVFQMDPETNSEKRHSLAALLMSELPAVHRIKFIIVSEPQEDRPDLDCEDVGHAFVDLVEILHLGKDIIDEGITVVAVDDASTIIGHLTVTVKALSVLQVLQLETS